MKTKFTALALLTVTALTLVPKPAAAHDRGLAVLGGFIGGMIVASEINHSRVYAPTAPMVVVNDRGDDYSDPGFWKEVTVKIWVPGCWIVERNHHGRDYRRYVGGHYEYRTNRVWVAYDRRDRHEREVGYGYGHRR